MWTSVEVASAEWRFLEEASKNHAGNQILQCDHRERMEKTLSQAEVLSEWGTWLGGHQVHSEKKRGQSWRAGVSQRERILQEGEREWVRSGCREKGVPCPLATASATVKEKATST